MITTNHIPVLMFGWELPPYNTGGLGVACYGLTHSMAQLGARIAFAMPRKLPVEAPFMELVNDGVEGLSITAINSLLQAYMNEQSYQKLRSHPHLSSFGTSIYDEAMRFGYLAEAWSRSQTHDIMHAHDWMSFPAAMKAHQASGKPWVAHVHATEYDRTDGHVNPQIAEIEYQGLNDADQIIAVSHYTKSMIEKRYSIAGKKIAVVHNGIDPDQFEPVAFRDVFPQDQVVLFVGRLTYQKGVEYFLQAAKNVLALRPHTIFLVVGAGDMEERLIMEASYMGIGGRVLFPGFMTGNKLKQLYQMADLFVMPSVSEPYGIVALEAVAAGVPAIISKQSGVLETLSNVWPVDFWDVDKMSGMMLSALTFPEFSAGLANLARQEARRQTWQAAAEKTLNVYRKVLGA